VSTAIYTNAVYANKLLSLDLELGLLAPEIVLRVARIFEAIRNCTAELRRLYESIKDLPPVVPSILYPNPTADPPEAEIPPLDFFGKVDRVTGTRLETIDKDNEPHAIYLARMSLYPSTGEVSTKVVVLVKFALVYNEEAHRLLAQQDPPLAPALYHCVRVIGGLHMVVMEYISEASPLHRFFREPFLPSFPNPDVLRAKLTKALELLHGKNLVFGDLRPLNTLYSREGDRVFLVDFDMVNTMKTGTPLVSSQK
jgi:serine/threonine protein kinase